ncbi:MAG: DUF493 domain-containing protein [Flavobacteriaceae bacterium]|jgi:putative lipoic acid-binding regulatory protein|nr:DUF493 domain-containing protein [Flavobacteriaceae bacterium]
MSNASQTSMFYDRLRGQLADSAQWPSNYLFKFILPSDDQKKDALKVIFKNNPVRFSERSSSKKKYVSISIEGVFKSPDEIIEKYKQVAQIEGVIQL